MKAITSLATAVALTFSAAAEKNPIETLEIGAKAPDFSLEGTDGKTYTLNSFKDAKYLVTVFTCNHCPDAIAARAKINQFAIDYKSKGVEVVAISSASPEGVVIWENAYSKYDDDFESMKQVAKEYKLTHPYLYDGKEPQTTSIAYGAVATPHVFIFGPDRTLLYQGQFDDGQRNPGPAKNKTVINTMEEILAGKSVSTPKTRVFGCSTKWYWKKKRVKDHNQQWAKKPVSVEPIDLDLAKKIAKNDTNKMRLVYFWTTTCAPCVAKFPMMIETYRRHSLRPFELITISMDPKEDADKVQQFIKEQHLPLTQWTANSLKKENRTTNNYHYQGNNPEGLAKILAPEWQGPLSYMVMIAPGGEIVWSRQGDVKNQELRNIIIEQMEKAKIR